MDTAVALLGMVIYIPLAVACLLVARDAKRSDK